LLWGGAIDDDGLSRSSSVRAHPRIRPISPCNKPALALRLEANARLPFQKHPNMLLKKEHIAVFQANWIDKSTNLEAIAKAVNIGLDGLVLLDDNPAQRAQVRMALPAVAVPKSAMILRRLRGRCFRRDISRPYCTSPRTSAALRNIRRNPRE
jgi:hypothetical protein